MPCAETFHTLIATSGYIIEAAGAPPPPAERAAIRLHAELVAQRLVGAEQVATLSRSLALAATGEVPRELVATVLSDAARVVGELA